MRWVQLCSSLNILWHCLSLGLEWKLTFSSPVANAEFSKLIISVKFLLPSEISSVQFSHSVVSDSLQPHESQPATPPCPSPSPGVDPNSRPSSRWCHPAISSSVVPFSSCPQIPPSIDLNKSLPFYTTPNWNMLNAWRNLLNLPNQGKLLKINSWLKMF